MTIKSILPVALLLFISCSKKNDVPASPEKLLTQGVWILSSIGMDNNYNDVIDEAEENILDCEKDNRYSFFPNGDGLIEEGALDCGTGATEVPFTWKLVNDNTAIEFNLSLTHILQLTKNQLVIYHELNIGSSRPLRLIMSFHH